MSFDLGTRTRLVPTGRLPPGGAILRGMSQENVEIVRAVHDGWARGDFRVAQELFAPDFSWDQPAEAVEPGSRRGPEVRDALRNLFEIYDDYRVEASEFIDGGDEVVVVARSKGTAKASRMETGSAVRVRLDGPGRAARPAPGLHRP
jgi:ketosteroid isomerase-like protein